MNKVLANDFHTGPNFGLLVLGMMLLGLLLRTAQLTDHCYTSDEVYELNHLSLSLSQVAHDPDSFPPLFRWLLSFVHLITGDYWLRIFPVLLGVGAVGCIGLIGKEVLGTTGGINCALWAAISAHQIDFSQQCRAYSMYILMVAFATLTTIWLAKKESLLNWTLFLTSSFLALGTHYFSALFITFAFLFLLIRSTSKYKLPWLLASFLFVLLSIPWMICLRFDLDDPTPQEAVNQFDFTGFAYTYLTALQGWTVGPSQIELVELPKPQGILAVAPWAITTFSAFAVLAYFGWFQLEKRFRIPIVFLFLMTPLMGGIVAIAVNTSYVGRYVAWIAIPISLLCGAGSQWTGISIRTFATYLLISINLLSTYNRIFVPRYDRENYRELAQFIQLQDKNIPVVVMSHYMGKAIQRELPSSIPYTEISFASNEPDDWKENLIAFSEKIIEQQTEEDSKDIVIVSKWTSKNNLLYDMRQQLIDGTSARFERRISKTIEVYKVAPEKLLEWAKRL